MGEHNQGRTSYLDALLGHARLCTGTKSALPPANWEWVGKQHRDGKCSCPAPDQPTGDAS